MVKVRSAASSRQASSLRLAMPMVSAIDLIDSLVAAIKLLDGFGWDEASELEVPASPGVFLFALDTEPSVPRFILSGHNIPRKSSKLAKIFSLIFHLKKIHSNQIFDLISKVHVSSLLCLFELEDKASKTNLTPSTKCDLFQVAINLPYF